MSKNEQLTLFKRFVDESGEGIGWTDLDGNIRYMNQSLCNIVGEENVENVLDQPVNQYYDEQTRKKLREKIFPAVLETGRWVGELMITAKDGTLTPATHNLFVLKDAQGNPQSFANVLTNLTERKKIEDELRSHRNNLEELVEKRTVDLQASNTELQQEISERKRVETELRKLRNLLSNVVNSMPSMLIGVDAEGVVTQWNRQAEKISGIKPELAIGRPLQEAAPNPPFTTVQVREAMQNRQVLKFNKVAHMVKGEIHYEDVTIYPLISDGLEGAVIRVDDVTERVNMDEMIVQSEKMLSVGGLAAGMAHEINNPLSGILQNAQVMSNRVLSDLDKNRVAAKECGTSWEVIKAYMERRNVASMIDSIVESGRRASDVVDNMLAFSRKGESSIISYDIAALLDKTVELASSDYNLEKRYDFRKIKIARNYNSKNKKILCESSKMQQVFFNLLKNSAQAMSNADTENPCIALQVHSNSSTVQIEIEDNGPGMSEDVRKRVFEPFFTTKDVGAGTGLGLSVSYFIITENHGGTMSVESTPGMGAKFIIRLPA
ncbi:MAG: PAS domain S-box protein [Proteobacteria bacterium]|nr:PAS domain S-box protein [Pseudomonadota bacterium]